MNAYILKKPVITEKSLTLANQENVYTFEVDLKANKKQIAAAVEQLYNVTVKAVNTVIRPGKRRRTGKKRMPKVAHPTKKALVTLKKGESIELFDLSS